MLHHKKQETNNPMLCWKFCMGLIHKHQELRHCLIYQSFILLKKTSKKKYPRSSMSFYHNIQYYVIKLLWYKLFVAGPRFQNMRKPCEVTPRLHQSPCIAYFLTCSLIYCTVGKVSDSTLTFTYFDNGYCSPTFKRKGPQNMNIIQCKPNVSQTFSKASINQCSESFEKSVKTRPFMFSFLL